MFQTSEQMIDVLEESVEEIHLNFTVVIINGVAEIVYASSSKPFAGRKDDHNYSDLSCSAQTNSRRDASTQTTRCEVSASTQTQETYKSNILLDNFVVSDKTQAEESHNQAATSSKQCDPIMISIVDENMVYDAAVQHALKYVNES